MANKKITELNNLQTPVANTQFVAVDVENDETKSVTLANLISVIDTNENQNVVAIQANVASIVDTDEHTVTLSANLVPSVDGTYDLGSSSLKWKDLHLTGSSIKLGGITISDLGNEGINITGTSGEQANLTTPAAGGVANVALELTDLQSRLTTNVTAFTNEDTALQARIAANTLVAASNDFVTYSRLSANINLVQDNVAAIVDATGVETRLNANLDIVQDNVAAIPSAVAVETRLNANLDIVQDNVTAVDARVTANTGTAASNDFITFTRLNSNINVVQDNVAAIIDGSTAFTGEVTMNDDLVISGNLIVNGSQVDLGVTTATISNNLIELSAELGPTDSPTTDSGLLINRGNEGNVFIGKSVSEDGVVFVHTLSPDTNVTIAIDKFMDAHANAFHAASNPSLSRVHFGLRSAEDTGIVIDDSGANVNFIADGSYIANVHYDGTINSQNAIISPKVFANGVDVNSELTSLQTNIDTVSSNAAAVESRRVANIAGAISSVLTSDLTADRVMITDGSGKISQSSGVTPTELDYLDGITLGTTAASKVVTSDAVGDTNFIRDVDIDGNVTIGTNSSNTVTITGSIDLGALS